VSEARLDAEELRALLLLRVLPGINDAKLRALHQRAGAYQPILRMSSADLGESTACALHERRFRDRAARGADVIAELGVRVVTENDAAYPLSLRELHDPPHVLFARGRFELLQRPAIAIVGSRRHSRYGAEAATLLARELSEAGLVVISGMARGIDAFAQAAALPAGSVGVLGCGIDVLYPTENVRLFERMYEQGLLLSEFAPGEPALRYHFPQRNRLIAALSMAIIVVEACAKSGSLITVEHAMDLGRDVFAVPGPIGAETSAGTNALIRDGAMLVSSSADVLNALGIPVLDRARSDSAPADLDETGLALWSAIRDDALHVDELARQCALPPAAAMGKLLELELRGVVRQLPGMQFVAV
jgi:DNA processing protein